MWVCVKSQKSFIVTDCLALIAPGPKCESSASWGLGPKRFMGAAEMKGGTVAMQWIPFKVEILQCFHMLSLLKTNTR